jgi:hypothetical protein
MSMKMTIGAINQNCNTQPGEANTVPIESITCAIGELGTWPTRWTLQQMQLGLQAGQIMNATCNATWIRSGSRTRKQRGLEQVDLDFLDQPWGLLVSVCTGIAQRVTLREVVAEVMLPMTNGWIPQPGEWNTLLTTGEGLLEELRKPQFYKWALELDPTVQRDLVLFLNHTLRKICWTGINAAGKLVVACPQLGDSGACIHVPLENHRALTWILKDTERSATFACLTNTCLVDHPQDDACRNTPNPLWQGHVPAVITSVCQYEWRGADDWSKLPQNDLQNGSVYWMGTSADKRRVTIETQAGRPARLMISKNSTRWSFFRRAWERIERLRQTPHIELRERRLMLESHSQDVVVVRNT